MSTAPPDIVLEHLRAIRGDLVELKQDMAEVRQRLGNLEAAYATASARIDRLAGDVACICKRLGPIQA